MRLELHPDGVSGPGHAGADGGPVQAPDHDRLGPAGRPPHLLDVGDGPDPGVGAALPLGHEQEGVFGVLGRVDGRPGLRRLERERDHHAGQDHARGERKQGKDLRIKLFRHGCLP